MSENLILIFDGVIEVMHESQGLIRSSFVRITTSGIMFESYAIRLFISNGDPKKYWKHSLYLLVERLKVR